MNLQSAAAIPGVTGIAQLHAQVRVELGMVRGPECFGVKIYQDSTGHYEAIPSHVPAQAGMPGKKPTGPARPSPTGPQRSPLARPGMQATAAGAADPSAWRSQFITRNQPSPESALDGTLRSILEGARAARTVEWQANPDF